MNPASSLEKSALPPQAPRPAADKLVPPAPNKLFEILRAEISYEVNLITQRTSFFVASQAFFFTSVGLALDRSGGSEFTLQNSLLFPLVPWVSLFVCAVTLISVITGFLAALQSRAALLRLKEHSDLAAHFPYRGMHIIIGGLLPSLGLPIIFGLAWLFILLGWA